jgi:hypothetical protein
MYAQLLTGVCIVQQLGCRGTPAKRARRRGSRRCAAAASCSPPTPPSRQSCRTPPLPPRRMRRGGRRSRQENPSLSLSLSLSSLLVRPTGDTLSGLKRDHCSMISSLERACKRAPTTLACLYLSCHWCEIFISILQL